jgi:thiamine biosynthesis lipoprotein
MARASQPIRESSVAQASQPMRERSALREGSVLLISNAVCPGGVLEDGSALGDSVALQKSRVVRRAQPWLGTLVEIHADGAGQSRWRLMAAVDAAFAEIATIHRLMSRQERGTDLQAIGAARAGQSIRVDRRTAEVLSLALELRTQSGGRFDPESRSGRPAEQRVGQSEQRVGLREQHIGPSGTRIRWSGQRVEQARHRDGPSGNDTLAEPAWTLEGPDRLRIHRPAVPDLDGIAKGYAVDRAIALLQAHCLSATVNAGGDLRVCSEAAAPMLIRSPLVEGAFLRVGALHSGAFATSVTTIDPEAESVFASNGICDPRSRRRRLPRMTVSVAAPTCAVADALTKVVAISPAAAVPLLAQYDASAWIVGERAGRPCVRRLGCSTRVTTDAT